MVLRSGRIILNTLRKWHSGWSSNDKAAQLCMSLTGVARQVWSNSIEDSVEDDGSLIDLIGHQ